MRKYFICSDVHSFFDEWIRALKDLNFDINNPDDHIIVCGDLFDRGNQSVECLEFVKDLIAKGRCIYVRGNHEDLLFECCRDLGKRDIGAHHVSNGTIKTIAHFLGVSEYDVLCNVYDISDYRRKVEPVLDFIQHNTVDYTEIGNFIFVHGWIPISRVSDIDWNECVNSDWKFGDWNRARWVNGMEAAHKGLTLPDKTIVCGHWHTSYGHSRYHKDGSEWNPEDCNMFPYIDKGIIAIDGCTAFSRMVNVIKMEENELGNWELTIPEPEELE